jgi:tetrahydromethanopterin S-methyltransferase subunit H
MSKELRALASQEGFAGADAAAHGIAALLWNDFLFYGPMTGTERIFAAASAAESIKAVAACDGSGRIPAAETHPVRKLFGKFIDELEATESKD